jgi:hypothetical protein
LYYYIMWLYRRNTFALREGRFMAPIASVLHEWTSYMECHKNCIVGVNSDVPFGTLFLIFPGVPGTYNFKYDRGELNLTYQLMHFYIQ